LPVLRTRFKIAHFNDATFSSVAGFSGAKFLVGFFDGVNFSRNVVFRGATFRSASFDNAVFSDEALFDGAAFSSGISFVNAEMKSVTSFEAAVFRHQPPKFFGTKLHEGTVWRNVNWPTPTSRAEAGSFVDAYERLKLEMDRLKKHEDELDFFALELQSRRILAGRVRGLPNAIYGVLCDYGRSYVRPLVGLLVTVLVGALLYISHFGLSKYPRAFGLSVANTFGVFGFRKDFIDPHIMESLSRFLQIVSAFQTLVGLVLLFFFGLAIRNRFRMK
jgi:Pentapeptide repeats (9 copies)